MTDSQKIAFNKIIGVPRGDVKNNRNVIINKFVPGEQIVTVHTTAGNLNLEFDEIDGYLDTLTEPFSPAQLQTLEKSQVPAPAERNTDLQGYTPSAANNEMKDILMNMIRGVKDNPALIPQAKAVFDGCHAVVAIQKQEIEMIKMANRKR